MRARVSTCTRWNPGGRESKTSLTELLTLDPFRPDELTQGELYEAHVQPFVERCLQGCCGSILTYGGWGSGKSYTLGTLDPQHLTLMGLGYEAAGVLPRCIRQLYNALGAAAAVEITCVEVQGDDVTDLLDPRVCAPISRLTPAGALAISSPVPASSSILASGGSPGQGAGVALAPATTRSPIAVAASRRKPFTLAVARSVPEALLCLKRAMSNRQAFVTSTRHSSSRTHAVIQLRWRNTMPEDGTVVVVPGPTSPGCAGGSLMRPCSAPPQGLVQSPPASSALGIGGGSSGPVCALTLVDTCSFCPLLPQKEGSAVKRSLLALTRVLNALQRRQAISLRESKLTRMLEGAVDQVLVLACLGGAAGDEGTIQLVKMLQQGANRESGIRRSRRASSSDSPRMSSAWEAASRSSLSCSVSARSLSAAAVTATGTSSASKLMEPQLRKSSARERSSQRQSDAALVSTPGRSRGASLARTSMSIPAQSKLGLFDSPGASSAPTTRRECCDDNYTAPRVARECSQGAVSYPVDCEDMEQDGDDEREIPTGGSRRDVRHVALQTAYEPPSGNRGVVGIPGRGPVPLPGLRAGAVEEQSLVGLAARSQPSRREVSGDDGPIIGSPVDLVSLDPCRTAGSGGRQPSGTPRGPSSHIPSGAGACGTAGPSVPTAGVPSALRRFSPRLYSPREKPLPAVVPRTSPGAEVRRSQGFSLLAGKWAPPPAPAPASTHRTDSFPIVSCVLTPRENDHRPRQPAARLSGSSVAPAKPAPAAVVASPTGYAARKRTVGIPARPPSRSPHPAPATASGGAPATPTSRLASRPSPHSSSPSPAGPRAPVVSLATVRPSRLASARYGVANMSHDSTPEAITAAAGRAAAVDGPVGAVSPARLPARRKPSGGGGGAPGGAGGDAAASTGQQQKVLPGTTAFTTRRSISSGTRWPSPLLRARRDEWLAEERRSRSAMPRSRYAAFRDRPTLSSQYRDLLVDFEAFKAKGHNPRRRTGNAPVVTEEPPEHQNLQQPSEEGRADSVLVARVSPAKPQSHAPSRASKPIGPSPTKRPVGAAAAARPATQLPHAHEPIQSVFALHDHPALLSARSATARSGGSAATPASPSSLSTAPSCPPASARSPMAAPAAQTASRPGAGPGVSASKPAPFTRQPSPPADDGLMSLTAAAAAAAASPRAPITGCPGALGGGRSRPGVSRCTAMHASPRPRCSPDTIIPTVVLDMSRLSLAAAGGASGAPGSARGASRLAPGDVLAPGTATDIATMAGTMAAAKGRIGEASREGSSGGDSVSDPSDNERGNMLGPRSLTDLNRMLNADAVMRQSRALNSAREASNRTGGTNTPVFLTPRQHISLGIDSAGVSAREQAAAPRAASGVAGISVTVKLASGTGAAMPVVASPRYPASSKAAAAPLVAAHPAPAPAPAPARVAEVPKQAVPEEGSTHSLAGVHEGPVPSCHSGAAAPECTSSTDFELPAVSFFIHQFNQEGAAADAAGAGAGSASAPSRAALRQAADEAGERADLVAADGVSTARVEPNVNAVCSIGPGGQQVRAAQSEKGVPASRTRRMDLVGLATSPSAGGLPSHPLLDVTFSLDPQYASSRQQLATAQQGEEEHQLRDLIGAAGIAAAAAQSVREVSDAGAPALGKEVEFALSDGTPAVADPNRMSVESAGVLRGSCTPFALETYCPAQAPFLSRPLRPSESSAGQQTRQEDDEQPQAAPPLSPQHQPLPGSLATAVLVQLAHVVPNHSDLDEHSTVLVGIEIGSDSEREAEAEQGGVDLLGPCSVRDGYTAVDAAALGSQNPPEPSSCDARGQDGPVLVQTPRVRKLDRTQEREQDGPHLSPRLATWEQDARASQGSVRERIAALEATASAGSWAMSPRASADSLHLGRGPRLTSRLRQSWAADSLVALEPTSACSPRVDGTGGTGAGDSSRSRIPSTQQLRASASSSVAAAVAAIESVASPRDADSHRLRSSSGGVGLGLTPRRSPRIPLSGRSPLGSALGVCLESDGAERPEGLRHQAEHQQGQEATPQPLDCPVGATKMPKLRSAASTSVSLRPGPQNHGPLHEEQPMQRSAALELESESVTGALEPYKAPGPCTTVAPQASRASAADAAKGARVPVGQSPSSPPNNTAPSAEGADESRTARCISAEAKAAAGNPNERSPDRAPRASAAPLRPGPLTPGRGPGRHTPTLSAHTDLLSPQRDLLLDSGPLPHPNAGRGWNHPIAVLSPERLHGLRNPSLNETVPGRDKRMSPTSSFGRLPAESPQVRAFGLSPGRLLGLPQGRPSRGSPHRAHEVLSCGVAGSADSAAAVAAAAAQHRQQQQLQLRGSGGSVGNVAASWRAAAAMSTSSSSSVRSCFRSTVGQQQQPQPQQLVGSADGTATATVVAVSRPPSTAPSVVLAAPGAAEKAAPGPLAALYGGNSSHAPQAPQPMQQQQPAAASVTVPPTAAGAQDQQQQEVSQPAVDPATACSAAPDQQPQAQWPPSTVNLAAPALGPLALNSHTATPRLPLAAVVAAAHILAPSSGPARVLSAGRHSDARGRAEAAALEAAARSARDHRPASLSSRLRRGGSRGSSAKEAAAGAVAGWILDPAGSDSEAMPPAVNSQGIVRWAAKFFASVKGKCAS